MGLFFGLFMVNIFMCLIEEKLESEDKLFFFYKRYVDDILVVVKDILIVMVFLVILNEVYLVISFMMEVVNNNKLFFIGMEFIKIGKQLKICVYRKIINKGLFFYY